MVISVRVIRFVVVAAFASVFLAAGVRAETVNAGKLGFSAVFGCRSQRDSRLVATPVGNITMTGYSCSTKDRAYFIAVADYPTGPITRKSLDAAYTGAIKGAADSVKGRIRSVAPYALGNITGRDALIDAKAGNQTLHLRIFYVGHRQFQVMFIGPKGQENSRACLAFLNSFALKNPGK